MHPRPTENETHTLEPRPKQRYDRWDGPRGRQRSPGRHWDKSWDQARPQERQWERSWNPREKRSWESNGNSNGKATRLTLGNNQPKESTKGIHQGSKVTKLQTESIQERKTPPHFDSQKMMEMMMKEFFQRKEEDKKWEKKGKPGFSLTS